MVVRRQPQKKVNRIITFSDKVIVKLPYFRSNSLITARPCPKGIREWFFNKMLETDDVVAWQNNAVWQMVPGFNPFLNDFDNQPIGNIRFTAKSEAEWIHKKDADDFELRRMVKENLARMPDTLDNFKSDPF